jgi:Rrf2 family iron-sulfur cluster assembly transcriptional regulator
MLYLSTKIEYGLNLLIFLAKSKSVVSLRQTAEKTGMPYRFLNKLARDLIKAKLIKAKEGKGGGYILAQKPSQIPIKKILDVLGEPLIFARCLADTNCDLDKGCKMKIIWNKIKKNIDRELNKLTLKDLI